MDSDAYKLQHACARAIRYLDCRKSPVGWTDFQTRTSGAGEDWITAFVLAHTDSQFASERQSFVDYLYERNAVIAYNSNVPPDADSSAWAMYVLALGDRPIGERTLRAWLDFIFGHWTEGQSAGFSTYARSSPITAYKHQHGGWSNFRGWTQTPCDEITALVFITLYRMKQIGLVEAYVEKWLECLIRKRRVHSYWWTSPWYTIRLVVEALIYIKDEIPKFHASAEHALIVISQLSERENKSVCALTPFDLCAKLVACSALAHVRDCLELRQSFGKCVHELLACQGTDGSWTSSGVMRIPQPDDTTPWAADYFRGDVSGTGGILSDSGVLTTASVYFSLRAFNRIIPISK